MLHLIFLAAPLLGFAAGFCTGRIPIALVRRTAAILLVLLPLLLLVWPLLVPGSPEGARYAAGMGLVLFAVPLALWMLFAAFGVATGSARRRRPE